jgi:hypothetical protein
MLNIFLEQVSFSNGLRHEQNNALATFASRVSNVPRAARFGVERHRWIRKPSSRGYPIAFVKRTLKTFNEILYDCFMRLFGFSRPRREETPGQRCGSPRPSRG